MDKETAIRAVIELLTRAEVNPVVKAEKLEELLEPPFNLSMDQIRQRSIGLEEQQAINRVFCILRQPDEILDLLRDGSLSEQHALFLDDIPNVRQRIRMAKKAIERRWDVTKTWKAIRLELDPRRKRELLKKCEREGFGLSGELKSTLEFIFDDSDRDVLGDEDDDEVLLPFPLPPPSKHAAAEVIGRILQLPVKSLKSS